jgi:dipeptidyl aminopeptidase/acylaminoacyl peptidase
VLYANRDFKVATDWSRDGKTIVFQEQSTKTGFDLWLCSLDDHKVRVFLQTPFSETGGRLSPDGHWLLYSSDESGKSQIYVLPLVGSRGKWQVSTDGGTRARWKADGKQIYYVAPDSKLMSVDVSAHGDEFTAVVPRLLFPTNYKRLNGNQYDVSADGKRYLVKTPIEQNGIAPLTLVQNWTAALKK